MNYCIEAEQLRAALKAIDAAEANGFMHCLAVFKLGSAGNQLSDCRLNYSDLIERAHPSDPRLNWGRFQSMARYFRFEDGKLVPLAGVDTEETKGAGTG